MDNIIHKTRSAFTFNHLYVIESLDINDGDKLTGSNLLKKLMPIAKQCRCLTTEVISVENAKQWHEAMDYLVKVSKDGQRPIIHFEIHGTEEKNGLYIKNGDVIEWLDVLKRISDVNYACDCNLFVSFAVCYGQYLVQFIKVSNRMPFCMSLGSFGELYEEDIEVCFFAFYEELLTSFDIDKAYQALINAHSDKQSNYCLIKADVLFAKVYRGYFEKMCTITALKKRAEKEFSAHLKKFRGITKKQRCLFVNDFIRCERENREKDYWDYCTTYFQLEEHPENLYRFLIFRTTNDLLNSKN